MTTPPPDKHYQTLMHRAWDNYLFIKEHATEEGPFEVTQLLATFLIAVAHPRERKLERHLNDLRVEDAKSYFGLPEVGQVLYEPRRRPKKRPKVSVERDFNPNEYLGDQIEILRNAVAHGNILFAVSEASEDIDDIRLLNIHDGRQRDSITTTFAMLERYTETCISIADHFFEERELGEAVLDLMFPDADQVTEG